MQFNLSRQAAPAGGLVEILGPPKTERACFRRCCSIATGLISWLFHPAVAGVFPVETEAFDGARSGHWARLCPQKCGFDNTQTCFALGRGRRDRCLASEHNKAPKLPCKLGRPGTGRLAEVALSGAVRSYRPAVNAVTVPNAPKCPCKNEHSRAVQPYMLPVIRPQRRRRARLKGEHQAQICQKSCQIWQSITGIRLFGVLQRWQVWPQCSKTNAKCRER